MDSSEGQAYIYALAPGQKAPFSIDLTPENSITQDQSWVADATNITVQAAYVSDINTTQYSALTATGLTASMIGGAYTVSGSVHNTGSQTTGNVWVETTFYNASGTVLSFNITDYISTELAPGDSATFISTPTDNTPVLSSEITNYSVFIQNSPFVAPVTPTPSPTPTAQPDCDAYSVFNCWFRANAAWFIFADSDALRCNSRICSQAARVLCG